MILTVHRKLCSIGPQEPEYLEELLYTSESAHQVFDLKKPVPEGYVAGLLIGRIDGKIVTPEEFFTVLNSLIIVDSQVTRH